MVTILPASFSTTSYSWHYKDDNQSLWKVKETQSEIIPSTNEDTGKKTSVETFFRRQLHRSVLVCKRKLHSEMQPSGKRKDIYTWVGVYLLKIEVHTASLEEPSCRRPRGS